LRTPVKCDICGAVGMPPIHPDDPPCVRCAMRLDSDRAAAYRHNEWLELLRIQEESPKIDIGSWITDGKSIGEIL
jgi:hypothetical protein